MSNTIYVGGGALNTIVNLNNVHCVDQEENKLTIYFSDGQSKKVLSFDSKKDCDVIFSRIINAYIQE